MRNAGYLFNSYFFKITVKGFRAHMNMCVTIMLRFFVSTQVLNVWLQFASQLLWQMFNEVSRWKCADFMFY